jgi:hypothetical protein
MLVLKAGDLPWSYLFTFLSKDLYFQLPSLAHQSYLF